MEYESFDYVTAWKELVYPLFLRLPQNVRDLFWDTYILADEIHQDKNLNLPWPDSPEAIQARFKQRFEELPDAVLAQASYVIFYFGHWGFRWCNQKGASWKFSMYADQVLRARLGQSYSSKYSEKDGLSIRVYQGMLRICFSSPYSWTWEEICYATLENYNKINSHLESQFTNKNPYSRKGWEAFEDAVFFEARYLKRNLCPKNILNTNKFIKPEEQIENW